ncbi:MAG TPA: hypothetical protein VF865_14285 [Acidobacteriaceae bacterium]
MKHSILIGAIFVAIVLAPCVIAMFSEKVDYEESSELNVLEEGFI